MKAKVAIQAGICGFGTTVEARSGDNQNVSFDIHSDCEKIRTLADRLKEQEPVDAYMEIHPGGPNLIMSAARDTLVGCCSGCAVPVGVFKGMQVAAGVALPKDITIRIEHAD
ncbi:MAG: hypothetical protein GC154_21180 [bacterium]|nr:hypothetical protein [bacterium]